MKLKLFAFLALAAATASTTSARILGENYVGMELGYARLSDLGPDASADGLFGAIGLNHALVNEGRFGFDLAGQVGYARLSGGPESGHSQHVGARARGYLNDEALRPFVQATVGYSWMQQRGTVLDRGDDWNLAIGVGVEVPFSDTFSLIYSIDWAGLERSNDSHFVFGVGAHKWINDSVGLGLSYSLGEGSIKAHTATLSVNVRI